MKKKFKLFVISILIITFISVNPILSEASQLPLHKETPIYLKMDKYFIIYTQPSSPFIDQQGRLLIPLRSIEALMGGKVSYNHSTKTATVAILNHTFDLTINSKTVTVDKNEAKMDTIPVLKDGAMFLPLRLFLDNTDIEYKWNNELKFLHITDKRVLVGQPFINFDENDYSVNHVDGSLHLFSYKIVPNSNGSTNIMFKAKNLTEYTIPKGKTDIQPLTQFNSNYGGFSVDSYIRPAHVYKDISEVKPGETVWIEKNVATHEAAYIITVARIAP